MNSKRKSRNSSGASALKSNVVIKGESLPLARTPLLTTPSPRGSTPNTPTATRDVILATAHVIASPQGVAIQRRKWLEKIKEKKFL